MNKNEWEKVWGNNMGMENDIPSIYVHITRCQIINFLKPLIHILTWIVFFYTVYLNVLIIYDRAIKQFN